MMTPVRRWQRAVVTFASVAVPLFATRATAGDLPPGPWWKPPGHQTTPPGGGPPIDHHGQPPPPVVPPPPPPRPPPFIPTGNTPPPDTPHPPPDVPETPEPATLVLALAGTGAVVAGSWRKRQASEESKV